jgi:hypothetical protein
VGVEARMGGRARLTRLLAVKSMLVNKAVQDIGMGRYNWQLFVLCGFGWFADKYVVPVLGILEMLVLTKISSPVCGCR